MKTRFTLSVFLWASLGLAASAYAAEFTVTRTDDPVPQPAPNACSKGGSCSLREAVLAANASDESDTIILGEGTYELSILEAGSPETGDLDFSGDGGIFKIKIQGVSPEKTIIRAAPGFNERLMEFQASDMEVTLSNLTIRNGNSPGLGGGVYFSSSASVDADPINVLNCNFINNKAQAGGGLFLSGSNPAVNIDGGTYSGNVAAEYAGGLALAHGAGSPGLSSVQNIVVTDNRAMSGVGGGIYQSSSSGVRFQKIKVIGNRALNPVDGSFKGQGGGIYFSNGGSPVAGELIDSVVSENTADGRSGDGIAGGGMFASGSGLIRIVNSMVADNQALNQSSGGGAYVGNGGGLHIVSSTFSGNQAGNGAGLYHSGSGGSFKEITNSTFSGNQASLVGGALWISRGDGLSLNNVTVVGNSSGSVGAGLYSNSFPAITIQNSLFANNDAAGPTDDCAGMVSSFGYNIFGSSNNGDCEPDGQSVGFNPHDIAGDPKIEPLADNGGPSLTHALLPDSPALDGGNPSDCTDGSGVALDKDQRGGKRPAGGACDIGAIESGKTDLEIVMTADAGTHSLGDNIVYTVTVKNNGPDSSLELTVTDALPPQVAFVSAESPCTEKSGTVSCEVGSLDSGASTSLEIVAQANALGTVENTATVTGSEIDANSDNDSSTATVEVVSANAGEESGGCRMASSDRDVASFSWILAACSLAVMAGVRMRARRSAAGE